MRWLIFCIFLLATISERVLYGLAHARGQVQVLQVAERFPLYLPTTFRRLAKRIGLSDRRPAKMSYHGTDLIKSYPQEPLMPIPKERQYNIIWLVSESLRADMLTPEIMPETWKLANSGVRFTKHYSGGNGTRMGIFSMFYGLYGTYWESFLNARRGPVIMDQIKDAGYALRMQTSAHFTYPEFDKTVWVSIPSESLLEDDEGFYWERDRRNVKRAVEWLSKRAIEQTPFFFFQFFESPHANYSFPENSIVRRRYLEDFNYATVDLEKDIELVKNRYINAVHHLDQQLGILFEAIEQIGLLQNTIVLVTGDHGEEFMEFGHWGHNSAFTDPQIRVPLLILAPNQEPRVIEHMTSHVDIAPTVLRMLGVDTPPHIYSLGYDLFGTQRRSDTVVSAWSRSALITEKYKFLLSTTPYDLGQSPVTTNTDQQISNADIVYGQHAERLGKLLKEMSIF